METLHLFPTKTRFPLSPPPFPLSSPLFSTPTSFLLSPPPLSPHKPPFPFSRTATHLSPGKFMSPLLILHSLFRLLRPPRFPRVRASPVVSRRAAIWFVSAASAASAVNLRHGIPRSTCN
ncbi:unnamed protein product, partial [Closterium sp. NIES-54]